MKRAVLSLLVTSCSVSVPLTGKRCATTEPRCVEGFTCVNDLCVLSSEVDGGGGGLDAGCPDIDPAASACPGTTWFLSATGSDTADGRSEATARRTPPTGISPGDVVRLLPGTYSQVPAIAFSGSASCPVLVTGEADGGTVIRSTLWLEGAFLVLRHLTFDTQNMNSVELSGDSTRVTFQLDHFKSREPTAGFYAELALGGNMTCTDCVVQECFFESGDFVQPLDEEGARFVFRGNRVDFTQGNGFDFWGPSARVEGNEFFGTFSDMAYLDFHADGGLLTGNVFHDIVAFFPDKVMVHGAQRVTRNTIARVSGNDNEPLFDVSRFDNNLVTVANRVVAGAAPSGGDFNIFDSSVQIPYLGGGALSGTDRNAAVDFDPGFIPLAGSAAIDGADPALPVPPGGGSRADVGAMERGAQRRSNGQYCLP